MSEPGLKCSFCNTFIATQSNGMCGPCTDFWKPVDGVHTLNYWLVDKQPDEPMLAFTTIEPA